MSRNHLDDFKSIVGEINQLNLQQSNGHYSQGSQEHTTLSSGIHKRCDTLSLTLIHFIRAGEDVKAMGDSLKTLKEDQRTQILTNILASFIESRDDLSIRAVADIVPSGLMPKVIVTTFGICKELNIPTEKLFSLVSEEMHRDIVEEAEHSLPQAKAQALQNALLPPGKKLAPSQSSQLGDTGRSNDSSHT